MYRPRPASPARPLPGRCQRLHRTGIRQSHHRELFEEELNGWYTDPALWPRDRSLTTLREWCSSELHTIVVDAGESPLEDDELDE